MSPVSAFIERLLAQIEPSAHLTDFTDVPEGLYTLRIDMPGVVGKTFSLPRSIVDRAKADSAVVGTLQNMLRSVVLVLRATRNVDESRDRLTGTSVESNCPVCGQTIELGAPVAFREGETLHLDCWSQRE